MKGFLDFIREQGVVGLAVGFILGKSVSDLVASIVNDLINPIIGLALGRAEGLTTLVINVAGAEILVGHFIKVVIDFTVIALVVYVGVKILKLDKLDKKKDKALEKAVEKATIKAHVKVKNSPKS